MQTIPAYFHKERNNKLKVAVINRMVENNGNPIDPSRSEIHRYCAWPGQACGYQIGHLPIDALLISGSLPLTVLDGSIDRFINGA